MIHPKLKPRLPGVNELNQRWSVAIVVPAPTTWPGVGATKSPFLNSSVKDTFDFEIYWITFIFNGCHRCSAAATPVKDENDFQQWTIVLTMWKNGKKWSRENGFSNPHPWPGRCRLDWLNLSLGLLTLYNITTCVLSHRDDPVTVSMQCSSIRPILDRV